MQKSLTKLYLICSLLAISGLPAISSALEPEDFALDLRTCLSPPHHLWVMSGWSTVNPMDKTVMGVKECYSPPFAAKEFSLQVHLQVDGHRIPDVGSYGKDDVGLLYAGGQWLPDHIERKGTYHHVINEKLISFKCQSALYPLSNQHGFLLEISLLNRSARSCLFEMVPQVNAGAPNLIPLNNWTYGVPKNGSQADSLSDRRWENDVVAINLLNGQRSFQLAPGEIRRTDFAIILCRKEEFIPLPPQFAKWKDETTTLWKNRLKTVEKRIPELRSDIPGLAEYYRRSLMSGLVCMWENPQFVITPFLSSLGMDGGGICCYLWDLGGYVNQAATLLLQEDILPIADTFNQFNLNEHYAFSLDGTGIGPWYSYNTFSFVNLTWSIFNQLGPQPELFTIAKKLVEHDEAYLPQTENLIDYGVQKNLLEMRGMGWEHFVVSPNAERAWCLERLADMGEQLGATATAAWREKAKTIRNAIRSQLWDKTSQWFVCKYPGGRQQSVYSIQVYDALRAGVCTAEMIEPILAHLQDGAFLGSFGVSSVSAQDSIHYELNDPDWSGGGAYIGEAPILVQTLYEMERPDLAWDVLQRLFWMGRHLPYFPQECYCDKPAVVAHKRVNEVAGLAGMQSILFGLAGFEPRMDGSFWIHPQPPQKGTIEIKGYRFHGRRIDLAMAPNYCKITVDDRMVHEGPPRRLKLLQR